MSGPVAGDMDRFVEAAAPRHDAAALGRTARPAETPYERLLYSAAAGERLAAGSARRRRVLQLSRLEQVPRLNLARRLVQATCDATAVGAALWPAAALDSEPELLQPSRILEAPGLEVRRAQAWAPC